MLVLVRRGRPLADAEEDEVGALTPAPASSEGWGQRQWALHYREHAQALNTRIVELQTQAGVLAKIERLEEGPLFPNIDFRPYNRKAREEEIRQQKINYRYGIRRIYFAIEDDGLRKRLIILERAADLTALRFHEAEHFAEHQEFAAREALTTPWARAASILTLIAIMVGALIGRAASQIEVIRQVVDGAAVQVGALAGAALGLIGVLRLRDLSEQARLKGIAAAREHLAEEDRVYQSILDEPEAFTSWEEFTGELSDVTPNA